MTDTRPHFTTRRGFIATAGFGGTALYGLWAFYGAAPGPLDLLAAAEAPDHDANAHDGHAAAPPADPPPPGIAAFEAEVRAFVARFVQPDGSVFPRPAAKAMAAETGHGSHEAAPTAGHDMPMPGMEMPDMQMPGMEMPMSKHAPGDPVDVPLLAARWYYEPAHLRLLAGQPYRFRMMATDVAHGASIQFGRGGRMIRLRPGQLVQQDLTFHLPGELLVTCTFFCGGGHDAMQARISVMQGEPA